MHGVMPQPNHDWRAHFFSSIHEQPRGARAVQLFASTVDRGLCIVLTLVTGAALFAAEASGINLGGNHVAVGVTTHERDADRERDRDHVVMIEASSTATAEQIALTPSNTSFKQDTNNTNPNG